MSVQSEIDRINNNVQSTLSTIADTGVSVGTGSDALPAAAAALANEKAPINHNHAAADIGCLPAITTEGDGNAYTATVPWITELTTGAYFMMIPHVNSTNVIPTLNVNGLGAKMLRVGLTGYSASVAQAQTANWLSANKPVMVKYDGSFWKTEVVRSNMASAFGTLGIANGGTGATSAETARQNLGITNAANTVISPNADYAEVGEWSDSNSSGEDRTGYFVCLDTEIYGINMRKATASDDVRGVTVTTPAFSGGCSADKFAEDGTLLPQYSYVAVMGIVPVLDDGTCVVGGRCMPNENGIATAVSGDYGYIVMERIDTTHVMIALEPGTDYQYQAQNKYVPTTRKVNGKELSEDISLTASDVGASESGHGHSDYMPKSGGTFTGPVYAMSGAGTAAQVRNTALASTETTPTVNGQICWTYE